MKLVGLMLARNEDWVIGLSARVALLWCDAIVVLLHNCTDTTAEILETIRWESELGRVIRRTWSSDHWEEMALRQTMLEIARGMDATHLAMIDADEVLTGNLLSTVRDEVEKTPKQMILQVPALQMGSSRHMPSVICRGEVMSSGMWGTQNVTLAFPDDPAYHWAAKDGYDLHHRHPMGLDFRGWECTQLQPPFPNSMSRHAGVMHLQFLSRRRLIVKQFLYQLNERKRWGFGVEEVKRKYVPTVREADAAKLSPVPESWWAPYSHLLQYLHVDREPWQEAECKRLLEQDPKLAAGLDDFGLMTEWGMEVAR